MGLRPGTFTDWDLNEVGTAAPSAGEEANGWAINTQPDRQVFNFLKNLYGRWVRFFDQTQQRATDLLEDDQILHGNTTIPAEFSDTTTDPPSWVGTRSTVLPAAYFSGAAVIGGYRHGPIDSPAITLTNERDVYVDLGLDGVWDFTELANGSGEPAVAADHVRFFKFVTDAASDITDGEYRIAGSFVNNGVPLRFAAGGIIDRNGLSQDVDGDLHSNVLHDAGNEVPGAYHTPQTAAAKVFLMGRDEVPANLAGDDSHWWAFAVNARYVDGFPNNSWARTVAADDSYLIVMHKEGFTILRHDAADGASWADSVAATTWRVEGQFGNPGQGLNSGNLGVDENGDVTVGGQTLSSLRLEASPGSVDGFRFIGTQLVTRIISGLEFSEFAGATGNWNFNADPNAVSGGQLTGATVGVEVQAGLGHILPDGAIITGMWLIAFVANNSPVSVQVMRRAKAGITVSQSMEAANGYDSVSNVGASTDPARTALSVDAAASIRTIDHANFTYWANIRTDGPSSTIEIYGLEIQFTIVQLGR